MAGVAAAQPARRDVRRVWAPSPRLRIAGLASRHAEAVYTGRLASDPPGTTRAIAVLKLGEDAYEKDFGAGSVRWGDYSATVVDPLDGLSFWTLQQYAAEDAGPNLRLRVAWGGGEPKPWHGAFSVSNGSLTEVRPLGLEADEPVAITHFSAEIRSPSNSILCSSVNCGFPKRTCTPRPENRSTESWC